MTTSTQAQASYAMYATAQKAFYAKRRSIRGDGGQWWRIDSALPILTYHNSTEATVVYRPGPRMDPRMEQKRDSQIGNGLAAETAAAVAQLSLS